MKPNKPVFIGITGGIGAGKSEILSYIRKHYLCEIYLADEVAHSVEKPGTACHKQLVALLGEEITALDGKLDRERMAAAIFADSRLLAAVNAIVHPAVQEYLLERLADARKRAETELFFVEAALLLECGYGALVDEMWYIYAEESVRRRRLAAARGYSKERIDRVMAKQLSEEAFRSQCDFVIDNSGSLTETYKQIDRKLEAFTWQE